MLDFGAGVGSRRARQLGGKRKSSVWAYCTRTGAIVVQSMRYRIGRKNRARWSIEDGTQTRDPSPHYISPFV